MSSGAEPQRYEDLTTHLGISNMALAKWMARRKYTASDEAELAEIQRGLDLEEQAPRE